MIDQFINFVIRPPRAEYDPDQYLWEKDFTLAGRKYKRQDVELRNSRGHALQCSHYVPSTFPDEASLPCVIYCHGNSGCRADANDAVVILLPSNITVFTLDFSGSGLSDGDYVSLGWHEKDDLKVAVSYLRSNNQISRIGLWGRSMGAVTSLLYGAEDPSIAGMVLDSAFSNLFDLMMELVDVYKIRLPKFTVAPKTFITALFGHANGDKFIKPSHSDLIFKSYAGDKNIIKFDGDHNSARPQFYYDSVSIFFYNVLHPPQVTSAYSSEVEKYYNLGDLKFSSGMDEGLLYEIISGMQNMGTDAATSSSLPPGIAAAKPNNVVDEDILLSGKNPSQLQEKPNEECSSYTSSNRESWGRCSSLGSNDESTVDYTIANGNSQMAPELLVTHGLHPQLKSLEPHIEKKKQKQKKVSTAKKSRHERFEALSQRLRLGILKRVGHRRNQSS